MKVYKLTDENGQTRNNTRWGEGVQHQVTGSGRELCSDGFIHFYESPEMASLMNPVHGNFCNPVLWEAEAEGKIVREGQLKAGAKALTTIRKIDLPKITAEQRVEIAIRVSLLVYHDSKYVKWANNWLDGTDKTAKAARVAVGTGVVAVQAAARAAAWAAEAAWEVVAARAVAEARLEKAVARAVARAWEVVAVGTRAKIDVLKIIRDVLSK